MVKRCPRFESTHQSAAPRASPASTKPIFVTIGKKYTARNLNGGSPAYNVYECKDGKYMSICCGDTRFWESLCNALGCDSLIDALKDRSQDEHTYAALADAFKRRTRDEWWAVLGPINTMAAAPVLTLGEALEDPHTRHRGLVYEEGPVRQVGIGPRFSDTPGSIRRLAPLPGEHTEEILRELGL